jgi:hypothetical protein
MRLEELARAAEAARAEEERSRAEETARDEEERSRAEETARDEEAARAEEEKEEEKEESGEACEALTLDLNGMSRPLLPSGNFSTINSAVKIIFTIKGIKYKLSFKQFSKKAGSRSKHEIAIFQCMGSPTRLAYFQLLLTDKLTVVVSFKTLGRARVITPDGITNYMCFTYGNFPTLQFEDENGNPVPFQLNGVVTKAVAYPELVISRNGCNATLTVKGLCKAKAATHVLIGSNDIDTGCVPLLPVTEEQKEKKRLIKHKQKRKKTCVDNAKQAVAKVAALEKAEAVKALATAQLSGVSMQF